LSDQHPYRTYKPLLEAKYLAQDNSYRYRTILRYFYEQQQRYRNRLEPDEILRAVRERLDPQDAQSYTEELLQQDLQQLYEWGNLNRRQSGKVSKIEEFKKKRYWYQATPYTIRLERLVEELESLGDSYGGSLEVSQFEKLIQTLQQLTQIADESFQSPDQRPLYQIESWTAERLHQWWTDLNDQFTRVTNNAQDFLAELNSVQVEDAMMTEQFMVYKETVIDYLRRFMLGLQRSSYQIEGTLSRVSQDVLDKIFAKIAQYELTIPHFAKTPLSEETLIQRYREQWSGIGSWFRGDGSGRGSQLEDLQRETTEAIRRIARYAQRLGERQLNMRSRKADYLHLANWFAQLSDLNEAHSLAAAVFGASQTRHLWVETAKTTEDIHSSIWETKPSDLELKPRRQGYRERTKASKIEEKKREKQVVLQAYLEQKAAEQALLRDVFAGDRVVLDELPVLQPFIRQTLLGWISRGLASPHREGKTEDGRRFKLIDPGAGERVQIQCTDGVLEMPNYVIFFLDSGKEKQK